MSTNKIEKFNKLISDEPSNGLEKAKWRIENRDWLDKSAAIAIKILRTLRSKGISQKDLAESMGVSAQYINKIVKGSENFSLETIVKIEKTLGITLVEVPSYSIETDYEVAASTSTSKPRYPTTTPKIVVTEQSNKTEIVWSPDINLIAA